MTSTANSVAAAGLGRRFGALLIDWILCVLVSRTFADPVTESWAPVGVLIVEYTLFLGLFTQTPGMWITKVRCARYADGRPIGIPRALLRAVLLCLVIPALLMDAERRGWHDRIAGAFVTAPAAVPPTAVPPTAVPPTAVPPAAVPPTAPADAVPPDA